MLLSKVSRHLVLHGIIASWHLLVCVCVCVRLDVFGRFWLRIVMKQKWADPSTAPTSLRTKRSCWVRPRSEVAADGSRGYRSEASLRPNSCSRQRRNRTKRPMIGAWRPSFQFVNPNLVELGLNRQNVVLPILRKWESSKKAKEKGKGDR